MSCVREASPPLSDDHLRHDMKKRRFLQPLRGLRRIFRRKGRPVISVTSDGHDDRVNGLRASSENLNPCDPASDSNLEPAKSHSTSHLDDDQADNSQRRSLHSTLLSVSHDSVFTPEQRSPNSGSEISFYVHTTRLGFPHSSVRAELFEAIHKRRVKENNASDDEEDLGLPRSPVSNSPTTADEMFTKENIVTKSSQSTCSDGSLLSMGSSEIDEDSYCHSSRHSSKLSLYEKRTSTGLDLQHNDRSTNSSNDDAASLSHSAAKHKMAVKPKRNHAVPHKKRQLITSNTLPTTPEVNEENSSRSASAKDRSVAALGHSDEHQINQNHVHRTRTEHHTSVTQITVSESSTQLKHCSLPAGVSPSPAAATGAPVKPLTRSKSNAASQPPQHVYDDVPDEKESTKKEEGGSFFSRLLLRRSSKKKKNAVDETDPAREERADLSGSWSTTSDEHMSLPVLKEEPASMAYVNGGLTNAMKHHPLFRQRVEPLNLSGPDAPPELTRVSYSSMVPVNMADGATAVERKPRGVQKSHSFRSSEKLPYTWCDDTPSLPVNIGCSIERDAITETYSRRYSRDSAIASEMEMGFKSVESSNAYEVVNFGAEEVHKWRPAVAAKSPEYGNASAAINRLNISVNDGGDAAPPAEVVEEAKPKSAQIPDVKVPVPAPRTSLLNRSPSHSQIAEKDDSAESNHDSINVTVTESADGQRSIISISGSPVLVPESDSSSEFAVEVEDETAIIVEPLPELLEDTIKMEELDDDVFQPTEAPSPPAAPTSLPPLDDHRVSETDTCEPAASPPPIPAAPKKADGRRSTDEKRESVGDSRRSSDEKCELVGSRKSSDEKCESVGSRRSSDEKRESVGGSRRSSDGKRESIGSSRRSSDEKRESVELPPKPVIVTDLSAGIIKVNDTTVHIRKKSRDVGSQQLQQQQHQSKKDEEPELMKVFARRSLKLKETDSLEEMLLEAVKSRDSDKENEDANTPPPEERRKAKVEPPDAVSAAVLPPKPAPALSKFQRSASHDADSKMVLATNVNENRLRCKSVSDEMEKCDRLQASPPPPSAAPTLQTECISVSLAPPAAPCEEKAATPFKRIQQRREEWEKRVQQAMKVHGTK